MFLTLSNSAVYYSVSINLFFSFPEVDTEFLAILALITCY